MSQFVYRIDLTKIDGEGDFSCPRCGLTISPDDETRDSYDILMTHSDRGILKEVVVVCKNCMSFIYLAGFNYWVHSI